MKALVIGAMVFTGTNLVLELINQEYEVWALVRRESNRKNIQRFKVDEVLGDLREGCTLAVERGIGYLLDNHGDNGD